MSKRRTAARRADGKLGAHYTSWLEALEITILPDTCLAVSSLRWILSYVTRQEGFHVLQLLVPTPGVA